MSRYIDAEALVKEIERCSYETWSKGVNPTWWAQSVKVKDNIVKCIERQPTADAVEVVRCKDCKHHPDNGGECDRSITHTSRDYVCEVNTYRYIGLDYCSYGERREG